MNPIKVAVKDFALPVPRVGSIEAHSGYGRMSQEGIEIHQRVQKQRLKADPNYQAEVRLSHPFEHSGFTFEIGGRVDGLFPGESVRIEEIKSTFNLRDLEKRLSGDPYQHPYGLQLLTYGYIHWLQNRVVPRLSFHLVSTRNWTTENLDVTLEVERYEKWLELRLRELAEETERSLQRVKRRQRAVKDFGFPFERPRGGQEKLIESVAQAAIEKARMLIQAPTGLGKTAGVLYPMLKEAMERGQRVIYVTPKNSQHAVAEDAVERFRDQGTKVRSLTITAKSKICFKAEPLCNPDYCEYARDYYQKVYDGRLQDMLAKKKKLTARVFQNMGESYQVCPFELQLEAAKDAEVVVCDYNYVFAPRSAFGRIASTNVGEEGKPNLVIDEAHNLPARAMGYYSPELSTTTLEKMRPYIRNLPSQFQGEAESLLNSCLMTVTGLRPKGATTASEIAPPHGVFVDQDGELRAFLSRYLESDVEIQPRDVVLRMCFYWSEFTSALDFVAEPKRPEFFTTFPPLPDGGGIVRITCCAASEMLEESYEDYESVVGFSATLKPFEYYAKLSGLDPLLTKLAEFQSPFPKERRKLLIIPEISTKYSDRARNTKKIAEVIARVTSLKKGNYFAFFPSFQFMESVFHEFIPPEGFTVLRQERETKAAQVEGLLEHLRDSNAPTVVFAVQGGVFSEGVDYPGDMVIGAFVVGPPLPVFDLEREKMRGYYEEKYGMGFDYAYSFPAMAKAVQAAGRVIRSDSDAGVIVLLDNRFIHANYAQSMPKDWFDEYPTELVSRTILKDIADFWASIES